MYLRVYASYITVFVVKYFGWSKTDGVNLTAAFVIPSAIFKVLAPVLVRFLKIETIAYAGQIGSCFATICFALLIDYHWSVMWLCSLGLSFCMSITSSVTLAIHDKYIGIKGFIGMIYTLGASAGEIMWNPVIGYLFAEGSYVSYVYLGAACCGSCLFMLVLLNILGLKYLSWVERHQINV